MLRLYDKQNITIILIGFIKLIAIVIKCLASLAFYHFPAGLKNSMKYEHKSNILNLLLIFQGTDNVNLAG